MSREKQAEQPAEHDVENIVETRERIQAALDDADDTISVGRHKGFVADVDATTDGTIEFSVAVDGGTIPFEFTAVDKTAPDNRTTVANKIEERTAGQIDKPDTFVGTDVSVLVDDDEAYLQVESRLERLLRRGRLGLISEDIPQSETGAWLSGFMLPVLLAGGAAALSLPPTSIGLLMLATTLYSLVSLLIFLVPILITLDMLYTPAVLSTDV